MRRDKIGTSVALEVLPGWRAVEGRDAVARRYRFRDFEAAFAFMTRVALAASRLDHHPEWTNVYDRVEVLLTTHSAQGVTALDVELAGICDAAAKSMGAQTL